MKAPSFDLITFAGLLLTACLMAVVCGVFLLAVAPSRAIALNEISFAVPFAVSGFTGLMSIATLGMAVNELTRK